MIYGGSQESKLRTAPALACALTGVIACASAGRARALSLIFALDAERGIALVWFGFLLAQIMSALSTVLECACLVKALLG